MKIKINQTLIASLMMLFLLVNTVKAETIIYDTITPSNYKTIKIDSDLCVLGLKCQNEVYINGYFVQFAENKELIQVPDNSTVRIVLNDPINTNLNNVYDINKQNMNIAIMTFIQPIAIIAIVILALWFIFGRNKRRRY